MSVQTTITFEEWPGESVTVRLSPLSMEDYFGFVERWNQSSTMEEFRTEIAEFVRIAKPEWTFPAKKFTDLDFTVLRAVINEWVRNIREVPLPLQVRSSEPTTLPEPSTPEPASGSARRRRS